MENVLYNLIDNALKYAQPPVHLQIKSEQFMDTLCLSIQDNGIGIHQDDQSRIFDKFYRVEGQKISGSGLGLNYAKRIILAHQGHLKVESTPNIGSTFQIFLPINI